jgi:hypothetical protein
VKPCSNQGRLPLVDIWTSLSSPACHCRCALKLPAAMVSRLKMFQNNMHTPSQNKG